MGVVDGEDLGDNTTHGGVGLSEAKGAVRQIETHPTHGVVALSEAKGAVRQIETRPFAALRATSDVHRGHGLVDACLTFSNARRRAPGAPCRELLDRRLPQVIQLADRNEHAAGQSGDVERAEDKACSSQPAELLAEERGIERTFARPRQSLLCPARLPPPPPPHTTPP